MTRTRVKICGITNRPDLEVAVEAGADAIGVICDVPVDTPREVGWKRARDLIGAVPPFVTSVLVTMPRDVEATVIRVEAIEPDAVQVHGLSSADEVDRVGDVGSVIAAVDVADRDTIETLDRAVDALLIDSTDELGAGGTGETHDWDLAREHVRSRESPVILAGGLTPANVGRAIARVDPYGVDVASGVEGEDGKDAAAVRRFISATRAARRGA